MQQGELTVVGQDSATIPLRGYPSKIVCHFKDNLAVVPCNPQHHDELECEVSNSTVAPGSFVLIIHWSVSGVREVIWRVFY